MPVSITGPFGTGIAIMHDRNIKVIVMEPGNVCFGYIPDEPGIFTDINIRELVLFPESFRVAQCTSCYPLFFIVLIDILPPMICRWVEEKILERPQISACLASRFLT
ncbi:hypothetical protein C5S42_12465 [Candidatus Methanomarinus sp.]|nr:hypothetical protein C5S42_12465 [ANME-2 cluster archaeon]